MWVECVGVAVGVTVTLSVHCTALDDTFFLCYSVQQVTCTYPRTLTEPHNVQELRVKVHLLQQWTE